MKAHARDGFTLIELMVVIAIIAILAAIAFPNLLRSRIAANEATAITNLKAYSTAQVTFLSSKLGAVTANSKSGMGGYCDNFRNLYYGNPRRDPAAIIELISKAFADAYARAPGADCAPTNGTAVTPPSEPAMYQGFLFAESKEIIAATATSKPFIGKFALLGVPFVAGQESSQAFWIGVEGMVLTTAPPLNQPYTTTIEIDTPSNPSIPPDVWSAL